MCHLTQLIHLGNYHCGKKFEVYFSESIFQTHIIYCDNPTSFLFSDYLYYIFIFIIYMYFQK